MLPATPRSDQGLVCVKDVFTVVVVVVVMLETNHFSVYFGLQIVAVCFGALAILFSVVYSDVLRPTF